MGIDDHKCLSHLSLILILGDLAFDNDRRDCDEPDFEWQLDKDMLRAEIDRYLAWCKDHDAAQPAVAADAPKHRCEHPGVDFTKGGECPHCGLVVGLGRA